FDRGDPTIEGFLTRGAVEGASNTVCVRGGELDGVELVFVPAAQVRGISDAGDLLHREQVGEEAQALFEYGSEEFNGTEVRNIEVLIVRHGGFLSPSVEVGQAGVGEWFTHSVEVEAEDSFVELSTLLLFVVLAFLCGIGDSGDAVLGHDDDSVVVSDDDVTRMDECVRADNGDIHRPQSGLDSAFCVDGTGEDGEVHLFELFGIAAAAIDDEPRGPSGAQRAGEKFAEEAILGFGGAAGDDDVSGLDLFGGDVEHPVVAWLQKHGHSRSAHLRARVDRADVGTHEAYASERFVDGGHAEGPEPVDLARVRAGHGSVDNAEIEHAAFFR